MLQGKEQPANSRIFLKEIDALVMLSNEWYS